MAAAVTAAGVRFKCAYEILKRNLVDFDMTLNDLKIGESGVISAVGGEGALRLRLLDMGLIPHTRVQLQKVAPLGDPIQILIRGYELSLRREDAAKITLGGEERQ